MDDAQTLALLHETYVLEGDFSVAFDKCDAAGAAARRHRGGDRPGLPGSANLAAICPRVEETRNAQKGLVKRHMRLINSAHATRNWPAIASAVLAAIEDPELFVFAEILHSNPVLQYSPYCDHAQDRKEAYTSQSSGAAITAVATYTEQKSELNQQQVTCSSNDETPDVRALLEVFAYGTIVDFTALDREIRDLISKSAIDKLRKLSLLTIVRDHPAGPDQVVSLSDIAQNLFIPCKIHAIKKNSVARSVGLVINLITECIEEGLFDGRIDSMRQQAVINACFMRDVRPTAAAALREELRRRYAAVVSRTLNNLSITPAHHALLQSPAPLAPGSSSSGSSSGTSKKSNSNYASSSDGISKYNLGGTCIEPTSGAATPRRSCEEDGCRKRSKILCDSDDSVLPSFTAGKVDSFEIFNFSSFPASVLN